MTSYKSILKVPMSGFALGLMISSRDYRVAEHVDVLRVRVVNIITAIHARCGV